MPSATIRATLPDAGPDATLETLRDFASFPDHTSVVHEVQVVEDALGTFSSWNVEFRGGLLLWTQRDSIDWASRTVSFEQTEGDFEQFNGSWQVHPEGDATCIEFTAHFDFGMPSLSAVIDPLAQVALRDAIHAVLRGMFGDSLILHELSPVPAGL
ncbi:type II toxin-antitoxin system RatA family toxin [Streptomyces chattanoogensis]|uniref:type II toxin-antitoxin system RatA family toxin n=1 Tax=Streptomyces chattanoogensis TaxID=66876 RepID=UPI0006B5F7D0|nr:SRPBCC family protein [Streptomyces chattanoogensis]